jgi:hypothetical protein
MGFRLRGTPLLDEVPSESVAKTEEGIVLQHHEMCAPTCSPQPPTSGDHVQCASCDVRNRYTLFQILQTSVRDVLI